MHLLYSDAYLPAVGALQALLPGIVTLSVWWFWPMTLPGEASSLYIYTSLMAVATNAVLNILWVPNYGIIRLPGLAVSYTVSFVMGLSLLPPLG